MLIFEEMMGKSGRRGHYLEVIGRLHLQIARQILYHSEHPVELDPSGT